MDINSLCTAQTLSMKSSMIRELVKMTKGIPDLISFAGGFPSPETFPKEELADLFYKTLLEQGDDALQYGSSGGDDDLKEAIIKYENNHLHPDEIHICNGATNGIYYILKTLIEPGDCIIAEIPSFLGSLVSFEAVGAEIIPVPMDYAGMDTNILMDQIILHKRKGNRIKFIYTIPDFQNPSGITMSRTRREKLLEIAIENNIVILEDDPYSKLRYRGTPEESLYSIARNKYSNDKVVVYIHSFSKLLGPGLRIAYTIASKELVNYLNSWSQKINVTTDRVIQKVVAAYLNNDQLNPQIERIKKIYDPLCAKMLNALDTYMPSSISWTKPEGGMFIWLTLPEDQNSEQFFTKALERKVAYIPGSKFYPDGQEKYNGLRLNFSFPTLAQIEDGIKRLAEVFESKG